MNKNIIDVFKHLQPRNDYVIWAGMAAYAHLGTSVSEDVDIFTLTNNSMDEIADCFEDKGWDKNPKSSPFKYQYRLRKEDATFDVIYSEDAAQLLFDDRVILALEGMKLFFVSKEWLYLTKIGQFGVANRKPEKKKRDLEAIAKLSGMVDSQRILSLVPRLTKSYWDTGWL